MKTHKDMIHLQNVKTGRRHAILRSYLQTVDLAKGSSVIELGLGTLTPLNFDCGTHEAALETYNRIVGVEDPPSKFNTTVLSDSGDMWSLVSVSNIEAVWGSHLGQISLGRAGFTDAKHLTTYHDRHRMRVISWPDAEPVTVTAKDGTVFQYQRMDGDDSIWFVPGRLGSVKLFAGGTWEMCGDLSYTLLARDVTEMRACLK